MKGALSAFVAALLVGVLAGATTRARLSSPPVGANDPAAGWTSDGTTTSTTQNVRIGGELDAGAALFSGAVTLTPGPLRVGASGISTDGGIIVAGSAQGVTIPLASKYSWGNVVGNDMGYASGSGFILRMGTGSTYLTMSETTGLFVLPLSAGMTSLKYALNSVVVSSSTAPTIASGWGQSASIAANGTSAMRVTTGVADGGALNNSTGVLTFPAATTKWNCNCFNLTSRAVECKQTTATDTTTGVSFAGYTVGTSTPTAWADNDVLSITCGGH